MSVHAVRGRHSVTRFTTVESIPGFSLLRLDLLTGRTHQIRVHLQSINHPVVGDSRYGGRQWKSVQNPVKRGALRRYSGHALHAAELSFPHPATGRQMNFTAEPPLEFSDLLDTLRGSG
jgi:23S rRNA pseudouridine1911/1915/1917 synthase